MKRIKCRWLTILAALALLLSAGAMGASAAAASSPEIVNEEGNEVVHKHFTGSAPEVYFEDDVTGELIDCATSSETGEITGIRTLNMTITYKSCTTGPSLSKESCKNEGVSTGTIVTHVIGKPVFLNKSHTEIGLAFEPETKNAVFAKCGSVTVGVHEAEKGGMDSVLTSFTKDGTTGADLGFTCASGGQQSWQTYWEGETAVPAYLEGRSFFGWHEVCLLTGIDAVTFEEGVKLGANAPIVLTTAATAVEGMTATLNGTVNPRGLPTKYFFEYNGKRTSEFSAGEGTMSVPVSTTVIGLTPGVVYHYHIVASSSGGRSAGAEMTFLAEPAKFKPAKGAGAFPVGFTSSGGKVLIESEVEGGIECKQQTGAGKFTNAKEARLTLKLTECVSLVLGAKCGTAENGKTGVIETKELMGAVDYTDPANITSEGREAGLALSPASGEVIAEIFCTSLAKITMKGSMIAVISPLNTQTKTLALALKRSGFAQVPSEYETESGAKAVATPTCSLNAGAFKPCAEESSPSLALTGEEGLVEAY